MVFLDYVSIRRAPRAVNRMQISRGFGWRIHCGVKVTELSTNKQRTISTVESEIGLWNHVLHGCVGIRKALQAVSRDRRRGPPRYSYMQSVQESWTCSGKFGD
jgi:hypothetical protein